MINVPTDTGELLTLDVSSFKSSKLAAVCLHRALLCGHDFADADLSDSDLRNATFDSCCMLRVSLKRARMMNGYFRGVAFQHADLSEAKIIAAALSYADFSEARLQGADVAFSDFSGTRLFGADLRCVRMAEAKFTNAVFNSLTMWPQDFDPKAAGAILVELSQKS